MQDDNVYMIKVAGKEEWILFYPNSESYRTRGNGPLPEHSTQLDPKKSIIGGL